MNTIIENYNYILNKKYQSNLKTYLNKTKNNKYDKYFSDIIEDSDDDITSSQSLTNNNITSDSIDEYYYKKPWNKLNIIHKKIKLKEFVNNLMIKRNEKKKLISDLIQLLNQKKITKKNEIDYDNINGKIISISLLKFKNNKYYI